MDNSANILPMKQKMQHFKGENEAWQRTLSFLVEESLYLKNRLSEIAKETVKPDMLEQLEDFQNTFLEKEMVLSIMQNDITEQIARLSDPKIKDENIQGDIQQQQEKLRRDMAMMHKEFIDIRVRFNKSMVEKL